MKNATEEVNEIIAELEQIAADMNASNQVLDRLLEEEEPEKQVDDED
jgi:hypothetical protein